ncbi:MarR family winged helix-turn-helix transcriptional regulator [Rhodococcus koreensis]|uniref:MarR family winged helix-turn-helix transcriptional regulator n=1 Tax=Rhodococcus koreensis TaxID=99653 RepID=UPI0036702A00
MSPTRQLQNKLDLSYLESTIGYAIKRAQIAVSRDIHGAFDELQVTAVQFSVLSAVADNPGASQAALAAALGVERPRMVPVIDSLEARGVVRRVVDPDDRRSRRIHLTSEGKATLDQLMIRFEEHERRVRSFIGESSARSLLSILTALAELD